MNLIKENLGKWIIAAIIITVGVLCIVVGVKIQNATWGLLPQDEINAISLVLGITFIVVGSLAFLLALCAGFVAKKPFAAIALPGASMIAVGASLVVLKYAMNLINLIISVAPYLLLAMGGVILLDAIFTFVRATQAKKANVALVGFICGLVLAAAAIVIGALCIGEEPVIKYEVQLIVFGIIVVLSGLFRLLVTFVKLPDTVVVVTKK